ncbi:hypothetical protein EB151_10615, partial [archaeon]|nr:hypothetical protein [archaeon]
MNIIGLYGAVGWDVLISGNLKSDDDWTHGSSVTLFSDGNHIASISEERLSGIKYDGNFPRKSIEYCLSVGSISEEDIDVVIVPSMTNPNIYKNYFDGSFHRILERYFPKAKIE